MPTDAELLHRHVENRDEQAFAELVRRHLGLVHAAALRRTGGRTHLADEVAQAVFTDLARKAAILRGHPTLTGWLYRSTRYAATDALRAEFRRLKLAQTLAAMPDASSPPEPSVDWAQLRPVIDEAMDRLKERDRELLLLRYFNGLTFAEVGARLDVAENTARMRVERALEKLHAHLTRRGVTSTSAALGLLLANTSLAAAPAGLATTVTATALAAAPAGTGAGIVAVIFMSKLTAPIVSAVFAGALTAVLWTSFAPATRAEELAKLRRDHARLTAALAPGADADGVATVAAEFDAQASAIARAVERKRVRSEKTAAANRGPAGEETVGAGLAPGAVDASRHRNRGQATPHDAFMSFAWGSDAGEVGPLAKLLWFDPGVREKAEAVLATMPEAIRAEHRTPEELFAFIFAADALVAPPPGADLLDHWQAVELSPGRVALRAPGAKPGYDFHQYQQTPDGWKYVVPEVAVENMPSVLTNETLAKLGHP